MAPRGSLVVDICSECQGTWVDRGEVELSDEGEWAEAGEGSALPGQAGQSALICPRCDVPLTAITPRDQQELILDRCPECAGLWLDAGELGKLQDRSAGMDGAGGEGQAPAERPPDWSWLRWTLHRLGHHRHH
jgi:Zn-finger nucleic acid-binding protein